MKNVLIINAHQKYEGFAEGKLNQTFVDVMKTEFENKGYEVKLTSIEKGYDPQEEVEKHVWADLIITQSPVYWFGSPWTYKKFVDEVFNTGLVKHDLIVDDGRTRKDPSKQYGTGGKMQGKEFMLSLTWNAPKEAFGNKDQVLYEGKTVDDAFIGHTSVYKFCGTKILTSFSSFNVLKDPQVDKDIENLKERIKEL